ncbi:MAG: hypothetical protein AB7K67_06820 [Hyphomicrobiaceae bacterium]|jgi:hypothetical protein
MRGIVVFLAILAAIKVGHQEYMFRTGTKEAIIAAYRERAIEACRKDAADPQSWTTPNSISVAIGRSDLDVRFWQVDNELWNARYRNPYLFLTAGPVNGAAFCEYDVLNGSASIHPL